MCDKKDSHESEKVFCQATRCQGVFLKSVMINTTNAFQELSYKFAISLDESTDIKNIAYPLSFVRYIHNEDINDDLLSCQALHERTV